MSASLACLSRGVLGTARLERAVRWLFVGGPLGAGAALIYFLVQHGHGRGYLMEVALITVAWLTLIPGAITVHKSLSASRP